MIALSVRLPNSLHNNLKDFAKREGISINQSISNAVADKSAGLGAESYLQERAARGNRQAFDAALDGVPDADPMQSRSNIMRLGNPELEFVSYECLKLKPVFNTKPLEISRKASYF